MFKKTCPTLTYSLSSSTGYVDLHIWSSTSGRASLFPPHHVYTSSHLASAPATSDHHPPPCFHQAHLYLPCVGCVKGSSALDLCVFLATFVTTGSSPSLQGSPKVSRLLQDSLPSLVPSPCLYWFSFCSLISIGSWRCCPWSCSHSAHTLWVNSSWLLFTSVYC
jgi:hypothetical protein